VSFAVWGESGDPRKCFVTKGEAASVPSDRDRRGGRKTRMVGIEGFEGGENHQSKHILLWKKKNDLSGWLTEPTCPP